MYNCVEKTQFIYNKQREFQLTKSHLFIGIFNSTNYGDKVLLLVGRLLGWSVLGTGERICGFKDEGQKTEKL